MKLYFEVIDVHSFRMYNPVNILSSNWPRHLSKEDQSPKDRYIQHISSNSEWKQLHISAVPLTSKAEKTQAPIQKSEKQEQLSPPLKKHLEIPANILANKTSPVQLCFTDVKYTGQTPSAATPTYDREPTKKQQRRSHGEDGHALKRSPSNIMRQALTRKPQGKRNRGRPNNSWRLGCTWRELGTLAQDRRRWRETMDSLSASCSGIIYMIIY
jgi:hypothetical protein